MPGDDVMIEVNGREADEAAVSLVEHEGWGHFTAMQVRGGRTRGLGLASPTGGDARIRARA